MNKNINFLILIVILLSCRSSRCIIDKNAINEFNHKIELIKSAEEKNVSVFIEEYLSALIFLSNITGISTRAEYSSTFGYRNNKYYKEDMKGWENWLANNKCKLTKMYIDSALSKLR